MSARSDPATVVVAGDNLFVTHRLVLAVHSLGYRAATARTADAFHRLLEAHPEAAVVDLAARQFDAVEAVRRAKDDPLTRSIPLIGFCGHLDEARRQAARAAGCDLVTTNGAVMAQLGHLLGAATRHPT